MSQHRLVAVAVGCVLSLSAALAPTAAGGTAKGDPLLAKQWGLSQIHAPEAWRVATGRGVVVAVLDGGVQAAHPDLRGKVLPGVDLVHHARNAWLDVDGHGTGVAGIIAAARGNGQGIVGVAPDARILPVKYG
jgi:subtilisin family serine protease